jgi:hypothetical protein
MKKAIYIAALLLTFAAAGATSRKTDRIQVVYREQSPGQWQAYVFGTTCAGTMHLIQAADPVTQPIVIECNSH